MPILDEVRITELPGADPLAGPELIPLVQGGVTKSRSAQNLVLDGGLQAHLDAADPHTQYLKESEYEADNLLKQATLSLDFANNKYEVYEGPVNSLTQMPFNTALDFTRGSSATARTATGKIQEVLTDEQRLVGNREGLLIEDSRTNIVPIPNTFKDFALGNVEVVPNAAVSPARQADASKIVATAEGPQIVYYQYTASKRSNFVISVFAKAGTYGFLKLAHFGTTSPQHGAVFDLNAGTVVNAQHGMGKIEPLGDGWYRCTSYTDKYTWHTKWAALLSAYVGSSASGQETNFAPVGDYLYLYHAQTEYDARSSTSLIPDATTFTSRSTTATFVDSAGVLQEAAIDVARDAAYKYLNGILYPIGLLLEAAATNLFLNSDTLSTQNVTVGAEPHTLHFTGSGSVALSGAFTGSLAGTGTGENNRVSLTFTPTAGTLTVTVTGTITNAMVEEGLYATSYFSSGGSQGVRAADISASPQVTRAADNCVRVLGDEFNASEGTIYCEFMYDDSVEGYSYGRGGSVISHMRVGESSAYTNQLTLGRLNGGADLTLSLDGVFWTVRGTSDLMDNGVLIKIAATWSAGKGLAVCVNGTYDFIPYPDLPSFPATDLLLVRTYNNNMFRGIKKDFRILPTALSEAELITLTEGN